MEIWKDIKDYENMYQISNYGRVKSLERIVKQGNKKRHLCEKILCQNLRNGYRTVYLNKNGNHVSKQVHRLVAETFILNSNNKPQVNHIDGNKQNNCVENLEWVTIKENLQHAKKIGLTSPIKHNNRPVIQYTLDGKEIKRYVSCCSAEHATKINHSNISKCCKGIYKQCNGYVWRYL